jgi:enamine deaminase RidA (YjgF/YER057c/UK114 family)
MRAMTNSLVTVPGALLDAVDEIDENTYVIRHFKVLLALLPHYLEASRPEAEIAGVWVVQHRLRFESPGGVHAPLGSYSHSVTVPSNTELIFFAGQVGIRADGTTPPDISGQADQAFANVVALLSAHGLGVESIVKIAVYIVAGNDGEAVKRARVEHLGGHAPASTTIYVPALVSSEWLVEVEATAARPAAHEQSGRNAE